MIAYVHLYTLLMIGPIANSLSKIDRALLEAARDAGASRWQTMVNVVIPLSKTGIALGSILVVTQVMGDYFVVRADERRAERLDRLRALRPRSRPCSIRRLPPTPWCSWSSSPSWSRVVMRIVDVRKELVK